MLWHSEKARRYYNPYRIEVSDANATRPICRTLPLYIAGHHQPDLEVLTLVDADFTSLHLRFFHHLADYRSVIELSMKSCTFRSAYDLRRIIEALQNTVNVQITAVAFKHTLVLPERLGEASIAWRQLYTVEVKDVHERDAGPLASVFLSLGYPIEYLQLDTVTFQSFAQFSQFVRKIPSLKSLKLTGVSCRHVPLSFMTNHAATELGVTPAELRDLYSKFPRGPFGFCYDSSVVVRQRHHNRGPDSWRPRCKVFLGSPAGHGSEYLKAHDVGGHTVGDTSASCLHSAQRVSPPHPSLRGFCNECAERDLRDDCIPVLGVD
ncbi:hypothetical protein C8Q72DRAFT_3184 [Fomitopsis betulina]|nr:hypothetical protein C8Q72DRAFT_3184 [Fomitopsis betulina]